jgi:hypothetical protein
MADLRLGIATPRPSEASGKPLKATNYHDSILLLCASATDAGGDGVVKYMENGQIPRNSKEVSKDNGKDRTDQREVSRGIRL